MGFLNFLHPGRRTSVDAAFEQHPFSRQAHPSTASPHPQSRGSNSGHGNGPRTQEEWQRSSNSWNSSRGVTITEITSGSATLKPRLVGITEGRPCTAPYEDESEEQPQQQPQQQQQPKSSGRNPRDAIRGLTLTLTSSNGEKGRLGRDRAPSSTNLMSPLSPLIADPHPAVGPRRRSSAFVDILDAHGEIRAYDFRSRVQASGSREYGEDVADRNIVENSTSSPSMQLFSPSTGAPLPFRPRGSVSAASAYRSTHRTESILEESAFPTEDSDNRSLSIRSVRREGGLSVRRSSAAISLQTSRTMSFDSTALEVVPDSSADPTDDDSRVCRRKAKSPYGRVSVLGCRTTTPVRAPNTSAGPYMRDDSNSLDPHSRSASPPQVPRYKQRQCSLPTDQLPSRVMRGSVRHAREALQASALTRESHAHSSHQVQPHHKMENYYDWSRFNRSPFGDHLQPASQTWDDSSSVHSDDPQPFSLGSSANIVRSRCDERERHAAVRTPQRQGSVSSFAPTTSDHSSPRFTGARSIRTAETSSIDMPHTSLFREMKFGGSSRSLRSRGGDSSIAPDCVGPEEDSCGDSIVISPATPVKETANPNPLSGIHLDGGFNVGGYESASIYDSDTESFREKRRQHRPDGEALLFRDKGFGTAGKGLPGLFNTEMDNLPPHRWADMSVTPTDTSDLGDDEQSIMENIYQKPRQNSNKPFTQRERLLALGYDYDSESDAEASVDSDEIPEERALQLLTSLIGAGGSTSGKQGEQKLDLNTVAKLRREIRKRRRTGAVSRRGSKAPTIDHRDG
ncbi:hypothetical protein PT974_09783 [Cladobotryum mycophilum]|uniref:Uncharacterized protein n=1 Tax=Cladobotryum mycophilum TaxID=491253 RepID=A0ABR0SIB3_9HYPO